MSTSCPSVSPRGYALGPTNPPRIIRAAEPSGLRWGGFAPPLFVTHPDIRTRWRSTVRLRDRFDAPSTLPYHSRLKEAEIQRVGAMLKSRYIVGAGPLDQ